MGLCSMVKKNRFILFIIVLELALFVTLTVFLYKTTQPSEEILIDILAENGIKISGFDSNLRLDDKTNIPPNTVFVNFDRDDVKRLNIKKSAYDILNKNYFAIADVTAYSDQFTLHAKVVICLKYDSGWKLCDEIAVLNANFTADES